MTAREFLVHRCGGNPRMVDAHREEVLAEADLLPKADVVAWLTKKAREQTPVEVLASKVARGAIRPNNLRMLPNPGFFEVDRTYTRPHHGETITFVVEAVSTSPDGLTTVAHGWRITPYTAGGWEPTTADDFTGWTEATQVHHYDKVPDPADGCHWCACGNRWPCKHAGEVTS
jgi:hypothetical protein